MCLARALSWKGRGIVGCCLALPLRLAAAAAAGALDIELFLTALSVRPGRKDVIFAHAFPYCFCRLKMSRSSSFVHPPFLT